MAAKEKYGKLPKAFKKKWLEALRSGEYKQGTKCLFDGKGYCCLGVACRLVHPKMNLGGFHDTKSYISSVDFKRVRDIKVPDILKGDYAGLVKALSDMNDGSGTFEGKSKTFKQIANWIEKNL